MSNDSRLFGRRILVVEDEMIASWTLEQMLADLGYEVVGPAARVKEALAMIETEVIDAVLLDINLNGEKSYPVADVLAARGVPFFFSTGYNKDSIPHGYRDFPMLQKPYDATRLAAILVHLLIPKVAGLSSHQ
jgi:DNA-binding NtrC family response regulator